MAEAKRKPGRPKGKRSSKDYTYVGGYVKVTTYKQTKHLLIDADMEISELLQQLLDNWIVTMQNSKKPNDP